MHLRAPLELFSRDRRAVALWKGTHVADLVIEGLRAEIDGKEILKGIDLEVSKGEVHAVMGPNGSGKSTLSYVLMGHPSYEVTGGSVTFKGVDLLELEPDERSRLGMFLAFQYPHAVPGVTVSSFLRQALNAHRKGGPDGADNLISAKGSARKPRAAMELLKVDKSMSSRDLNDGSRAARRSASRSCRWRCSCPAPGPTYPACSARTRSFSVIRTHTAGSLRAEHCGQTVTLTGWVARRRDHGGVAFIDLRDASGYVQVVIRDEQVATGLRNEFCLRVVGEVTKRPEGNANPALPTGDVEVTASEVEVLNEAAPLPFQIDEHVEVGEEVRLRYRYLDLRRAGPAAAIRLRSEVSRAAREVLHGRDFVEIETPTLTRSTPEGARDFLVPARLAPGSWYALPQSPQLFKQLLMVAGMERYFQIARCYRDEDFRADRQPEFTQLDIEMSFVDQDDVIEISEAVVSRAVAARRL